MSRLYGYDSWAVSAIGGSRDLVEVRDVMMMLPHYTLITGRNLPVAALQRDSMQRVEELNVEVSTWCILWLCLGFWPAEQICSQ